MFAISEKPSGGEPEVRALSVGTSEAFGAVKSVGELSELSTIEWGCNPSERNINSIPHFFIVAQPFYHQNRTSFFLS